MSDRDDFFGLDDDRFPGDNDDIFSEEDGGFDWDGEGGDDFADFADGDFEAGLGDEEADTPEFGDMYDEEDEEGGRTIFGLNRVFVLLAAVILIILCVTMGIVGVVLFANRGPSDIDMTVTAAITTNTYVAFALEQTATQNSMFAAETATAESWTPTPSPVPTDTPEPTATPTTPPPPSAVFFTPTSDGQGGGGEAGLGAEGVAGTATALAEILGGATPTSEGVEGFVTPTPSTGVALPTAMPSTGLFDEGFAGGAGVNGLIAALFVALGLGAVIVVSRWLRTQ